MPHRSGGPSATARSHRWLQRSALAAIATNILIVITGGVVRVTGSGLGCPTWPTCDGENLVPVSGGHAGWQTAIEFGNRLMSFVVLAAVVAVWILVRRTGPHTPVVHRLAVALPIGVVVQAVLGGVTVLAGLLPITVAAHFLVSMGLIAGAVVLHERIRPDVPPTTGAGAGLRHATSALMLVAAAVLVLGTVVTGAGPHGGDVSAARFPVDIRFAAITHADAVWLLVGLTLALVAMTWRGGPPRLRTAVCVLLAIEVVQGLIGYTQYALGVPPLLVAFHITGAALVWTAAVVVWVRARPAAGSPP